MTIEITQNMIAIYSIIAIVVVVAAYIYGCARTDRKYKEEIISYQESLESMNKYVADLDRVYPGKTSTINSKVLKELEKKIDDLLENITDEELADWAHQHSERPHVERHEEQFLDSVYRASPEAANPHGDENHATPLK